ncbi:MAG: fibronectin type III domain-containing protein, partial [Planctomycetota bacterium]
MTATPASDPSGVEYYFANLTDPNHDSGWRDNPTYVDTGLDDLTQYTYTVKARDKSSNQNETAASTAESATTEDGTAPAPDPMTWASEPNAISPTSITMTAITASDASGVEYYFTCTAGGGHNSNWQDSTTYIDTGLADLTLYTYIVKARDKSANQNTTADSTSASATTPDGTAPAPDPMIWATLPYATGPNSIAMMATTASDPSGVEYYFAETTGNPGGNDSGWQDDPNYEDTDLDDLVVYTYTVKARDKSPNQNETAPSSPESVSTGDGTPPIPDPMSWMLAPYATGPTTISMTATPASDPSGVQYYFANITDPNHDSIWQDSPTYVDTGLNDLTEYTYTVKARDKSFNGNETATSDPAPATTQDGTPPAPDQMTWASVPVATGPTSISMTATTATDVSDVEYYFEETTGNPGGSDSGWQDSPIYEDTGLNDLTEYTYTVIARDKSGNQNETAPSTAESATTEDGTAPVPDPVTWASVPIGSGPTSIIMTADTATDPSGVEYYFTCTAGGGHDSGWQDNTTYEDTGLAELTQYTYMIRARDKSSNQNITVPSTPESATTGDGTPPAPDPMTWASMPAATGPNSISMMATTASDPSGVEYYFGETSGNVGGSDSGWQDSPTYEDTGLAELTVYIYTVRARDKSPNLNENALSTAESATTEDGTAPAPDPMTWASVPVATGPNSISMTATTASDASGVEYYFANLTDPNHDSGWQDDPNYKDTGLNDLTQYTYTTRARDKSSNQNETAPSSAESATTEDGTAPAPDPMTWASEPNAISPTSITMTATTASDASGVEYYFTCTAGGGNDSGWQDDPNYEDTGLADLTLYTYTVKARDKRSNQNETAPSTAESATTEDGTAPVPDMMTWATAPYATGPSSIAMVATTASDASEVEYYFTCTAGGGHNSNWQDSPTYIDTGLADLTQYTYTVRARDKSPNQNETAPSTPESVSTGDGTPPLPDPMTWLVVPNATSPSSISMTADTATDPSGVEYHFTCTAGGGNDSGWQDNPIYEDTGLNDLTEYTYTVIARDKSGNQNTTGASLPESATTPDGTPPVPDPMTWLAVPHDTGPNSISMTATTATDPCGVEYYFTETSGNLGGDDSGWQDSTTYIDTELADLTVYIYTVRARDKSPLQNETGLSTEESAMTGDGTAPIPDPATWATEPYATGPNSIAMTATTASDPSGVEYYFANLTDPNHDSGWQD